MGWRKEHAVYRMLLVPLDGSPLSEQALPLAATIAQSCSATVRLAHVHLPFPPYSSAVEGVDLTDEHLQMTVRRHERAYLESVHDRLMGEPGLAVSFVNLEGGAGVVAALAHEVAASRADLIVMTTHGRGGLARFWLGSVTDALVRQVNAPLLLLRPDTPPPVVRQILIPLDGSALAERAIEPALALGATLQAQYTLLRIVEPITDAQSAPALYDLDAARSQPHLAEPHAYLDDIARRLRAAGATVHGLLSVAWKPASAIIEAARERQADLIAMATHGRSGLKRLLLGSVADKVLRGSELPLLLIRPEGSN